MNEHSPVAELWRLNPFLTPWALPLLMSEAWLAACLSAHRRTDDKERNPRGHDQLPVPAVLQDSKDHDLFA